MGKSEFEKACERVANELFFFGTINLETNKLEYRKGKNIEDVRHARIKAIKAGNFRTENELSFFALYLKSVLKMKKETK